MDSTGYIKREDRKKILLISDDIRLQSGVATVAREIVVGTSNKYNWVNLAAAINHPDKGKKWRNANFHPIRNRKNHQSKR